MAEEPVPPALAGLTGAEVRVAVAVGRGLSNRAAADELFISVKTVDHHLQRIYRKLDLRSRAELAVVVTRALADAGPRAGDQPFRASLAEQPDVVRLRGGPEVLTAFEAGRDAPPDADPTADDRG